MKNVTVKTMFVLALAAVVLLSGCTNWQKKYKALEVEQQNLSGRYENCMASLDTSTVEQTKIGRMLQERDKTIEELEKEIVARNISPSQATGFGDDMDVSLDARAGTITVILKNSILFDPGSASLKKSTGELKHVLNVIRDRYSTKSIDVVGHTDSDPIKKSKKFWKDNWELSAQRALAVLRYLDGHGIKDSQIRAVAAGASSPIASNTTSSGKSRNRRVEIVVHTR